MPQYRFAPCIPSHATVIPTGPDWLHEIKHDGYRLIVHREHDRVRLFTRGGFDWTAAFRSSSRPPGNCAPPLL